jgi:protein involved in polysaccharide export with SLBB domain
MGNFLSARESRANPTYVILPGDHVSVFIWGAVQINEVFVVDGQGNIFMPGIGPVRLAGVLNAELTNVVRAAVARVYRNNVEVYTNLVSAAPLAVFVTGAVCRPGRYAGLPSDSPLFFLEQAGGIDPVLGSYRRISILRGGKRLAQLDLYAFLLRGELDWSQFDEGDTILVEQRGPVIELNGDLAKPAILEFQSEPIHGSDALQVIPNSALATEITVHGLRNGTPIERTMSLQQFRSFELHHGDTVTLREDGRSGTILVKLEGEFEGPSVLSVRRDARLVDVLNFVPVNPTLADANSVYLRRASVAKAQKDAINDSLFRLERSALLALSTSRGESDIRAREAELTQKFVERARLIQPLGRVVTSQGGQQLNIVLEDGDVIVVPPRTNLVRVAGEVMMAHAVMYEPGMTAERYIGLAGSYSERADENKVIIIHANAEVEIGSPGSRVGPGDEILVPPRVDTKRLQNIADLTQVLYQIAVAAAVVLAL